MGESVNVRRIEADDLNSPNAHRPLRHIFAHVLAFSEKPVPRPAISNRLPAMSAIERIYECIRYFFAEIEFSLSPQGHLRGWVKICTRILLLLAIPAICLGLLVALLVPVFTGIAMIFGFIEATFSSIFMMTLYLLGIAGVGIVLLLLAKFLSKSGLLKRE